MGEMSRMTQFKEKSEGKDSANLGIFDYPVLMAADILLYDANYIPVGEDQFQHLELTRNLAIRFNNRFGETFVIPEETAKQVEFMGVGTGIRIRDLSNPEKKMSKSTAGENCKIMLSDEPAAATKKIMHAETDSLAKIDFNFETQPGISNLLQIEALATNRPLGDVVKEWQGKTQYGDLKKQVASSVEALLSDFQRRLASVDNVSLDALLETGEKYANGLANQKLREVYQKVGLV